MKFILLGVISLILVGLMAIGFFKVYDYKPKPITDSDDDVTIIYDKGQLKIINPECEEASTQLSQLIDTPQTCQSTDVCDRQFHDCGFLALNHNNHIEYKHWLKLRANTIQTELWLYVQIPSHFLLLVSTTPVNWLKKPEPINEI